MHKIKNKYPTHRRCRVWGGVGGGLRGRILSAVCKSVFLTSSKLLDQSAELLVGSNCDITTSIMARMIAILKIDS